LNWYSKEFIGNKSLDRIYRIYKMKFTPNPVILAGGPVKESIIPDKVLILSR
jgi:hypothetical protein